MRLRQAILRRNLLKKLVLYVLYVYYYLFQIYSGVWSPYLLVKNRPVFAVQPILHHDTVWLLGVCFDINIFAQNCSFLIASPPSSFPFFFVFIFFFIFLFVFFVFFVFCLSLTRLLLLFVFLVFFLFLALSLPRFTTLSSLSRATGDVRLQQEDHNIRRVFCFLRSPHRVASFAKNFHFHFLQNKRTQRAFVLPRRI